MSLYGSLPLRGHVTGQGVQEYGLAIGLVVIVGLAALSVLGPNISHLFQGTITSVPPRESVEISDAEVSAIDLNALTDALPDLAHLTAQGGPLPTRRECYDDGICLFRPIANGREEVAGGNGGEVTIQHASVFNDMLQQLKDQNADPTLIQRISQLANLGHRLGQYQNKFSTQCQKATDCDWGNGVGATFRQQMTEYRAAQKAFNETRASLERYLNNNEGLLSQQTQNVLSDESRQIALLAQGVQVVNPKEGVAFISVNRAVKSTKTHKHSNTVCEQGGENCIRRELERDP